MKIIVSWFCAVVLLCSVSLSVAALSKLSPPTVSISHPSANSRFLSEGPITITGRVSNLAAGGTIFYKKIGDADFTPLSIGPGTNTWSAPMLLQPGTNFFQVKAMDLSSNTSPLVTRSFYYAKKDPLTLQTNGVGKILGFTNGASLELTRTYQVTAKPGPGQVLLNWQANDQIVSDANVLDFVMTEGLVLKASFVANPFAVLKGQYNGLYYAPDDANSLYINNFGMWTLKLSSTNGSYTGKIASPKADFSFSGQLRLQDSNTAYTSLWIPRDGLPLLHPTFRFDLLNPGTVAGEVSELVWDSQSRNYTNLDTASLSGLLCRTNGTNAGLYNFKTFLVATNSTGPSGEGYGSVTINTTGSSA